MTVLAKMQPYLFPYIGYYQLLREADVFVVSDNLSYINKGWINRNRLKIGAGVKFFSVPVKKSKVGQPINTVMVYEAGYSHWLKKFLKTVHFNYCRAPFYSEVMEILYTVFQNKKELTIYQLATQSLIETAKYLGIDTEIVLSAEQYDNLHKDKQERIVDVCQKEKANTYINLPGGAALYSKSEMRSKGIEMYFLQPGFTEYPQQRQGEFIPGLSIIDILMNNSISQTHKLLDNHSFI